MRQDLKIYGKEYDLYRDGEYIGFATWVDDPNIGETFLKEMPDGSFLVFVADEWEFKSE